MKYHPLNPLLGVVVFLIGLVMTLPVPGSKIPDFACFTCIESGYHYKGWVTGTIGGFFYFGSRRDIY